MLTQFSSATAETASSIHSSISSKLAYNYNKFNETYPYLSSAINDGTNYIYSIGDKISSYTSVIQPVDGSEEREITRTPPNENLGENVIPLNEERIELVNHLLDLHSSKPSKECFKHYDDNVIFEDQLIYTTGLPDLKAQFYGTLKIPVKSTIINYKILENTLNILRISMSQKYLLPFVNRAFMLESELILEFNESKKIYKHTELWYGRQPIVQGEILRKGAAKIVARLVSVPE
ncbi:unnamed protein product [Rhizophagus irregularis]|uniref:Uncharacterized protein n=1 Tax=Rhizophagus irregularis TaxID=588596 RepID=A0A2N1NXQ2_9GLOM|nr:hypothetical protein RhiirC2_509051 [Rhizophagus irregularis]CAB4390659.1 unnamed protein product [Rhizophagus irregularis]CAB5367766.1 unnamed protein product [Rhizophagus irregularis]